MTGLHVAHLFLLGLWGGLAVAELTIELGARTLDELRAASRLHHRLDLFVEVPLLLGVLGTGLALAHLVPLTPLHWVKIAAGLVAIGANAVCVGLVVARRRAEGDDARLERLSRQIRWTGAAVPFGLVALVIGFAYFT